MDSQASVPVEAKDLSKVSRIQYAEDVESCPRPGGTNRGTLLPTRKNSSDTMSIRSLSRNRSIDPANILPIQYRTM
jgi:sodium/potassium-transporting ATPase subunit alpha